MADIRFDTFKGIRPRVRPRLLPPNESQTALNARLGSGALEPWNDTQLEQTATTDDIQSIFRMRNNGSPLWLESENDVDYARGPVPDDILERTYYTGEAEPRMTYIGIAAGTAPLPDDYRILGIPAPVGAPTLTGDALPDNQVTVSLDSGGIQTPSLKCDFVIDQNLPANMNSWYMALTSNGQESDNGYEPTATERTFNFNFSVGKELRVTAVVDANNVTVEDANAGSFLAAGSDDERNGQTWFRTDDAGTTRAGHFRFYLPNSIDLQMTGHNLLVDDVIRVTAVPQPVALTLTQPGSITAGGGSFFGWESDNGAGFPATNTWIAAPVGTTADGFFKNGSVNYPFQDVYATSSGAAGADFSIDGSVDFELIERGGEPYSDIATDIESRIYTYTFVSELGEEGPPAPASSVLTIPTDGSVTVDGFDTPPSTQRNITDMRIYRSNTGTEATEFQFVAEIADPFDPYVDTIADTELGEVLQTTTWEPPPSGLEGIVAGPNGILAGFVGKTLWLSEPYFPHAWPPEYKQAVEHDIVGVGALPNGFAILTKGTPYALTGDHPRGMSLQQFQFAQACANKRSITSTLDSVMYASPDGLCEIGARGFSIVTRNHATKREWQTYNPTTMKGFWHDNKYFGFHSGGAAIFEPRDESIGLTTTADVVRAGFLDQEEDTLFVLPEPPLANIVIAVTLQATAHPNQAMWSDDGGLTWTDGVTPADRNWNVVRGNGLGTALAGADDTANMNIMRSVDGGQTWTQISGPSNELTYRVHDFAYLASLNGGTWVAVGLGTNPANASISTDDGLTWSSTAAVTGISNRVSIATAAKSKFWAVGNDGIFYDSSDGVAWGTSAANLTGITAVDEQGCNMIYDSVADRFIVVTGQTTAGILITDDDGDTWTVEEPTTSPRGLGYSPTLGTGAGRYVMIGGGGQCYTSDDRGDNWTQRTLPDSTPIYNSVDWDDENELFVAVAQTGAGGRALTSPDGITWTVRVTSDDANAWMRLIIAEGPGDLEIREWDASATARTTTWKSGKLRTEYPLNLGAGRILATTYPVTLNVWDQEGTNVVVDRSVTSDEVFRLPGGYLSAEFEVQVANDDTVELVHLAETVEELLQG